MLRGEYADAVWDPSARSKIHDIELVQNSAIRFIRNLKGRTDSVSEARNQLQLQSLEERRKNHRLCFLTQILQSEDQHHTLSTAYDEIAKDRQLVTVTTRSAARGEPISLCTKKSVFFTQVSCHELFVRCVEKTTNNYKTAK